MKGDIVLSNNSKSLKLTWKFEGTKLLGTLQTPFEKFKIVKFERILKKNYNEVEMEMKCNLWINDKNTVALDLAIPYSNSLILKLETGMI